MAEDLLIDDVPVRPGDTLPVWRLIACIERELRMRRHVYPARVQAGRMTVRDAAREIWEMHCVLDKLKEITGTRDIEQPDLLAAIGKAPGR